MTHEAGLRDTLLLLVALLGEEDRPAAARLEPLRDPRVPAGVVRAVVATGLWGAGRPRPFDLPAVQDRGQAPRGRARAHTAVRTICGAPPCS
ncbi:hypothetical protein ACIPUC_29475 [Streptomyces sp. LARHCF249]